MALEPQTYVSLRDRNTMRLPATAHRHWVANSQESLLSIHTQLDHKDLATAVLLGGGSNVIFATQQLTDVVQISADNVTIEEDGDDVLVHAEAGKNWHELVQSLSNAGYWGIENLAYIPGQIGAAPMQNIGAYGVELKDVVTYVDYLDRYTGQMVRANNADCEFDYRDSMFKRAQPSQYWIWSVGLRLSKQGEAQTEYPGVADMLEELNLTPDSPGHLARAITALRKRKLPDPAETPNAGSFFKNPVLSKTKLAALGAGRLDSIPTYPVGDSVKLSAGALIDQCGCKSLQVGDARVSEQHALVITNKANATGSDVLKLAELVQSRVAEKYGVTLEIEPRVI